MRGNFLASAGVLGTSMMVKAYLVPHPPLLVTDASRGGEIADTRRAFGEIAREIAQYRPDVVVIFSPHSIIYDDYIHISPGFGASGDFGAFGAGHISMKVEYDTELANLIAQTAQNEGLPAGTLGERNPALDHGTMVPLHFIGTETKIVRISLSGLSLIDHYRFGICVQKAANALLRRTVIIASGDMSHKLKEDGPYGFAPEGPEFDEFLLKCAENADFLRLLSIDSQLYEPASECGLRSLVMLAGTLDGMNVQSHVGCYEGPFGVGYLTALFSAHGTAPSLLPSILAAKENKLAHIRGNEDAYVQLARRNVESFIRDKIAIEVASDLPNELLTQQAGVFVSIKKDGKLRGCIGTIAPTQPSIAHEILKNSISAATDDPRFEPIKPSELSSLTYSVDVLSPSEPIDSPVLLDVNKYGVIVTNGYRRGLLLPSLAGIDTVEQQISIALQKAGINANEDYSLERFEVVRHT